MSKDTIKAIKNLGVCMGAMAYTVGTPGQDISDVQLQSWVDQNVPGLSVGDIAAVKRILFESQTIQLSVLRQSILDPDSSAKVRLPDAEKEDINSLKVLSTWGKSVFACRQRVSGFL